MSRFVWFVILFATLLQSAAAEPVLLYGPETGEFWLAGMAETDPHAGLTLYSERGTLLWPEQTGFLFGLPLDGDPAWPPYGRWIREQLGITLGQRSLPLYLGAMADPGTPAADLSAVFYAGKFVASHPLSIQVVPEPRTFMLAFSAVLLAICMRRR